MFKDNEQAERAYAMIAQADLTTFLSGDYVVVQIDRAMEDRAREWLESKFPTPQTWYIGRTRSRSIAVFEDARIATMFKMKHA